VRFGRALWPWLGSSSNWTYRTAAPGTNALRARSSSSSSASSSLMGSTVIPPALFSTNLASKPRPLANRTATRFPFHSLGKCPANAPPLSAYDLRASYPYRRPSRPSGMAQDRGYRPLEAILVRLVGIHRRFIAQRYRRGCPAVAAKACTAIPVLRLPGSSCGPPSSAVKRVSRWGAHGVTRKASDPCGRPAG